MIFTTAEFTRHTGIGSKLFAWSRAKVLQQHFNVNMLTQNWVSIRGAGITRGGIDYSKLLGKIFLFDNFHNDQGELGLLDWNLKYRLRANKKYVNDLYEAKKLLLEDWNFIVFRWHGSHNFNDLYTYHDTIKNSLVRISKKKLPRFLHFDKPYIGLNIRLGNDFVDFNSNQTGHFRTPIDWYLDNINEVRKRHGALPIYVVSDGSEKSLQPFRKFPNTYIVNNKYAIQDLLLLGDANVIMGTGHSSFSAWGAFLSDAPSYASKDTTFEGFQVRNGLVLP